MNELIDTGRFSLADFGYEKNYSEPSSTAVSEEHQSSFSQKLLRGSAEEVPTLQDFIDLVNALDQVGIFDTLDEQDITDLEDIIRASDTEALAVFLYERTGYSDDPQVTRMFERIFSNDEVTLKELGQLGATLVKSLEARIELVGEYGDAGLFENLSEEQLRELEDVISQGSLADLANYMFENAGYKGDPSVARVIERMYSDNEVSFYELESLGRSMERSKKYREELIVELQDIGLLENLTEEQRGQLQTLIRSGDPKDAAIFLFETSGSTEDPSVVRAMEKILADDAATFRDVDRLASVLERSRGLRDRLLDRLDRNELLDALSAEQKTQLKTIAEAGTFKDMAVFLFENTGYSEDPEVVDVMESILADDVVAPKDIELLGSAIDDARERAEELQKLKEETFDLLKEFDKADLLDNLTEAQRAELDEIVNTATLNEVATFLYENTGFMDDPDVTKTMERLFSDDEVTLYELNRLGYTMNRSRTNRVELVNDFEKAGLLDNLTDAQEDQLEAIVTGGSLKDLATFLYESTGYMDDPAVVEVMDSILADDVVLLKEIKQLGSAIGDSRDNRIDLIKDFERANLLDGFSSGQRRDLEELALGASLKDMAQFLYENVGYSDDPSVASAMNAILSDNVVSIEEIEQLGEVMEQSMDDRIDLIKDFNRADILDSLSSAQRRQLEEIATGGTLRQMAQFLYETTGFSDDPGVNQVMNSILSDNVVSISELQNLGEAIDAALENSESSV